MRHTAIGRLRPFLVGASGLWVVALFVLSGATATATVTSLTVSTTYPTVQVDPGGQVDLPILVQSPSAAKVDLSVNNVPDGFKTTFRGGGFIVSSIYTTGNEASPPPNDLKLRIEVPDAATAQDYNLTVHASSNGTSADLQITLKVAPSEGAGVSMTTAVQAKTGAIGSATTFSVTLHNDTAADLKFSVTVPDAPAGWSVTAKPSNEADPNNFSVAGGDTDTITVSANPPSGVDAGDYGFTVVASSGDTNTAQLQLGIRLSGSEDVSLVSTTGILNLAATAGTAAPYSVTVTNSGTAPLTNISLTATPPEKWTVTYNQTTIASLDPLKSVEVPVTITPASDAIAGDYALTLSVRGGTASDSINVRTTVNTSTLWGYVGIGLIALVVIALLLVFRRYGRR